MAALPLIVDRPELRERTRVFRDRNHAGEVLAALLLEEGARPDLILGVPAGGVLVGAIVARRLAVPLELAVVSKVTPSWNTEMGYGAVAWDGTQQIDSSFVRAFDLSAEEIRAGVGRALEKVARRVGRFRGERRFPDLSGSTALLVDDGLASGVTLRVAAEAVRRAGAASVLVGVPTGHRASVEQMAAEVGPVYCVNVRGGARFAVADAYQRWTDLTDDDIADILEGPSGGGPA